MYPHIGAPIWYSSQIVRLVKPILRPSGISPRVSRICLTAAVTRYASSRSKRGRREENGATWRLVSRRSNASAATIWTLVTASALPVITSSLRPLVLVAAWSLPDALRCGTDMIHRHERICRDEQLLRHLGWTG